MSTFKFRLSTVLRLRDATRDERRGELAQALRADDLLRERQESLQRESAELQSEHRARSAGGRLEVDWLLDAQRYQIALHAEQQAIVRDRQAVAKEIEKRRQALVEADREVRVLEKLREVQQARHRTEAERQEMKQIDEVAARTYCSAGDARGEGDA